MSGHFLTTMAASSKLLDPRFGPIWAVEVHIKGVYRKKQELASEVKNEGRFEKLVRVYALQEVSVALI